MGYVYLINKLDTYEYKIGVTKREVVKRLKELQTGNEGEIVLINTYESDVYKKIERNLHRLYGSKNKKGEWFTLTDEEALSFTKTCEAEEETINFLLKYNEFYN